jgi:transcriptional regulator with XRE-family HTH domain
MGNNKIRALKDNFWSRKRLEVGLSIRDVAEAIHFSTGITGMYFTGQRMPTETTIKQICDLFDVDIIEGTREFVNACRFWDAEFGVKSRLRVKPEVLDNYKVSSWANVDNEPEQSEIVCESVLRELYRKIPYEDFETILEGNVGGTEVLKLAYKKVDFDTYIKLVKLIKEEQ